MLGQRIPRLTSFDEHRTRVGMTARVPIELADRPHVDGNRAGRLEIPRGGHSRSAERVERGLAFRDRLGKPFERPQSDRALDMKRVVDMVRAQYMRAAR